VAVQTPTAPTAVGRAGLSDVDSPGRGRLRTLIGAGVMAALVLVGILVAPSLRRAIHGQPATADHTRAPGNVQLVDAGSAVTLTWTDPANGTVNFIVRSELRPLRGETRALPLNFVPGGVTRLTVSGLEPKGHYCFLVGAVYSTTDVQLAPYVCTAEPRAITSTPPSR
jgi:hypothetical protein